MLACVSMSYDNGKSTNKFDFVLTVVSSLYSQLNTDYVIIGRDLNVDLSRLQSSHTSVHIEYCNEHNFI